eukprot:8962743-Ditylum_brightwellii.AAC.1
MADKDIGHQAHLPGELVGVGFDFFALKEPEYTMMLISTYGQLLVNEGQKENVRCLELMGDGENKHRVTYTEVVSNHFQFCGAVDDHNNKRHD